jgi:DNA-binding transcriptional regulator YiaG
MMATRVTTRKKASRARPALKARKTAAQAFSVRGKSTSYRTELTDLRRKLGISQKAFALLSSSSQRAVARWEAGEKPGEHAKRTLVELQRLQKALAVVMKKDSIPEWLEIPNKALGGLKPLEVIQRGEIDRIWSLIYYLQSGEPF